MKSTTKKALVTGASEGIGLAIARKLSVEGYAITGVSRSENRLKDMAGRLNGDYIVADLSTGEGQDKIAGHLKTNHYDLLVNNAGIGTSGPFTAVTLERQGDIAGLGSAQQLAAFRIVQEALTNALRHGDTSRPAGVVLAEAPADRGPGLVITVRNTMRNTAPEPTTTGSLPRVGHGLPGMRERASLAGGWLTAEGRDGEFVVTAFLPGAAA